MDLPSGWIVAVGGEPSGDGVLIDLRRPPGRSFAVPFLEKGAAPGPAARFALQAFPTLDDVWTLYMMARLEVVPIRPKAWEAMSYYVEEVRQGFCPERVTPERSVQAVLRSISAKTLPEDPTEFVAQAIRLCAVVAHKVEAGARILDDDLVGDEPRFQVHLTMLRDDALVYDEDLTRARRLFCVVREKGPERRLPLLVLDRPQARLFKLWARRDHRAPGGNGYALLLVRSGSEITLSADPARHVEVGYLTPALDAAEQERGGEAWYDGSRHERTLIASARSGTKLSLDDVLEALGKQARISVVEPLSSGRGATRLAVAAVLALVGVFVVVLLHRSSVAEPMAGRSPPLPLSATPMGNLQPATVNLLDPISGVKTFTPYALILGVCSYGSAGEEIPRHYQTGVLQHSCNNAWELAHVLIRDYAYDPKNITLLLDDQQKLDHPSYAPMPLLGPKPTRHNVLLAIERFKDQHPEAEKERITFLFYYSGHGSVMSGAPSAKGLPYLQLANWESDVREKKPLDDIGLPMDRVDQLVQAWVPSKHVLYLFDNCHAGWAVHMGEKEDLEIRNRWADGITYGIAAAHSDQNAWEPSTKVGMSLFTRFLVEGLEHGDHGAARADTSGSCDAPDHIVTHDELQAYLEDKVPKAAKSEFKTIQEPIGAKLDATGDGQFLFVAPDVEDALARRHCR